MLYCRYSKTNQSNVSKYTNVTKLIQQEMKKEQVGYVSVCSRYFLNNVYLYSIARPRGNILNQNPALRPQ